MHILFNTVPGKLPLGLFPPRKILPSKIPPTEIVHLRKFSPRKIPPSENFPLRKFSSGKFHPRKILHLSCKFEHFKKIYIFWCCMISASPTSKNIFLFQKWSNLHQRSVIDWIERRNKFQIFLIFIFQVLQKNTEADNYLNAVEREPVPTTPFYFQIKKSEV